MDLYARLGVKRGADDAEIKKAYRSLAKQLHPDRNTGNPKAAERFAKVTAAYDLLSDPTKRARYDRGEIDEEGNPKNPFGGGFGGARPGPNGALAGAHAGRPGPARGAPPRARAAVPSAARAGATRAASRAQAGRGRTCRTCSRDCSVARAGA